MTEISPNIFDYATKELSQDAFFCYLSSFALPENRTKFPVQANVADKFLQLCGLPANERPETVQQQYHKIDIMITTARYILIIEDKTASDEHSNQIARYIDLIRDIPDNDDNSFLFCNHSLKNICVCFLKTADYVRDYELPEEDKYSDIAVCSLRRKDIYDLLQNDLGNDYILQSFFAYLHKKEERANILTDNVIDWSHYKWFAYLEKILLKHCHGNRKAFNMGWVPTPDGSFYGCWFDYNPIYTADKKTELLCAYKQMAIRFDKHGKTCQVDLCYKFYTADKLKKDTNISDKIISEHKNTATKLIDGLKTVVNYDKKKGWFNNNRCGKWRTYAYLRFSDIDKKHRTGTLDELLPALHNFIKDTSQTDKFIELVKTEGNYLQDKTIWLRKVC